MNRRTVFIGLAKDWGIALVAILVAFAVWNRLFVPTPQAAGPAAPFELSNLDGVPTTLASFGDGPVVLNFWFTTCGPCRAEIPELTAFARAHPDAPVVGVSVDRGMSLDRLAAASGRLGIDYHVVHDVDGQVASEYGVGLFPTTFILRGGTVERVVVGAVTRARLEKLVYDR